MEKARAVAKLRHLRISPRKVRLMVDLIRGLKVTDAIVQLELSKKSAARPVLKLLNSAVANAKHNYEMIDEKLVIKEAMVDEGATLHRWLPKAMGRATPIRKRSCHVTLVLEGEVSEKKIKKDKKNEKKNVAKVEVKSEIKPEKKTKVKTKDNK